MCLTSDVFSLHHKIVLLSCFPLLLASRSLSARTSLGFTEECQYFRCTPKHEHFGNQPKLRQHDCRTTPAMRVSSGVLLREKWAEGIDMMLDTDLNVWLIEACVMCSGAGMSLT